MLLKVTISNYNQEKNAKGNQYDMIREMLV